MEHVRIHFGSSLQTCTPTQLMGKQKGARGSKQEKTQQNTHTRTVFKVAERISTLDIKKRAEYSALEEGVNDSDTVSHNRENESLVQLDTRALK